MWALVAFQILPEGHSPGKGKGQISGGLVVVDTQTSRALVEPMLCKGAASTCT